MAISVDVLISRSVSRMGAVHPKIKEYAIELIKRAYKEGIRVQISSGFRSLEEQAYIYGQGRASFIYKGKQYGRYKDKNGKQLPIVSKAQPGSSVHNYGLAIDYFLVSEDGNTSLWTVNNDWKRVGAIAKQMGFEWGGDWTWKDYPHLQYNRGLTTSQLAKGLLPSFLPITTPPPTWDGLELKKGQIGRLTITKAINLWQRLPTGKLKELRVLQPGEVYRVYDFDEKYGGQYDLGANNWVTKIDGHIKYETPSAAKRLEFQQYYNK